MLRKVLAHLRAQWIGVLALLIAIGTGSAYAANTVFSSDIVNGEVKSPDIGNNQVKSIDVRDDGQPEGGLGSVDIANGSLTRDDVADESLSGQDILDGTVHAADITNESLTGTDVVESTLGQVPSARIGGLGRWAGGGSCDPENENYVDCAIVTLNLPQPARVLLIGQGTASREIDSDVGLGVCELVSNAGRIVPNSKVDVDTDEFAQSVALTAVTGVQTAGSHDYAVDCNQIEGLGAIEYFDVGISAVAISPD
jgi:hypothetical protein